MKHPQDDAEVMMHATQPSSPSSLDRSALGRSRLGTIMGDLLSRRQKELPASLFADAESVALWRRVRDGSRVTIAPAELELFAAHGGALLRGLAPHTVIDLAPERSSVAGRIIDALAGTGRLEALIAAGDAPHAHGPIERATGRHPWVTAQAIAVDMTVELPLERAARSPRVYLCLGNVLGAYPTVVSVRLLRAIRASMDPRDRLILGLDLRRDEATLRAAWGAAEADLAAYHHHVLARANRSVRTDFDLAAYRFRSVIVADQRRVEAQLVARRRSVVTIPDVGQIHVAAGESIRTALSGTFDRDGVAVLLRGVGLAVETWVSDATTAAFAVAAPTAAL